MPRYMVAVDESDNAKVAFYMAIHLMDKKKDQLYIVNVIPDWDATFSLSFGLDTDIDHPAAPALKEQEKKRASALIDSYSKLASSVGVR